MLALQFYWFHGIIRYAIRGKVNKASEVDSKPLTVPASSKEHDNKIVGGPANIVDPERSRKSNDEGVKSINASIKSVISVSVNTNAIPNDHVFNISRGGNMIRKGGINDVGDDSDDDYYSDDN